MLAAVRARSPRAHHARRPADSLAGLGPWPDRDDHPTLREAAQLTDDRLAGARPISYAGVRRAIGQAVDGLVPTEAEISDGRVADGPAAMPLLKFEQRAAVGVVTRHLCERKLQFRPQR